MGSQAPAPPRPPQAPPQGMPYPPQQMQPPGPPQAPPEWTPQAGGPPQFAPPSQYAAPVGPPAQQPYMGEGATPSGGPYGYGPPPGGMPQGPPPMNPYGQAGGKQKGEKKFPTALVVIIVIGLVVIAGAAGLYFLKFNKSSGSTTSGGPEATVVKYFQVLPSGDLNAIKALFAPDSQPSDTYLQMLSKANSYGAKIEYLNPQVKTVSQNATDAQVQLLDVTISVSMGGQSVQRKLSQFSGGKEMLVNLKNVNGQWLMEAANSSLPSGLPGI